MGHVSAAESAAATIHAAHLKHAKPMPRTKRLPDAETSTSTNYPRREMSASSQTTGPRPPASESESTSSVPPLTQQQRQQQQHPAFVSISAIVASRIHAFAQNGFINQEQHNLLLNATATDAMAGRAMALPGEVDQIVNQAIARLRSEGRIPDSLADRLQLANSIATMAGGNSSVMKELLRRV